MGIHLQTVTLSIYQKGAILYSRHLFLHYYNAQVKDKLTLPMNSYACHSFQKVTVLQYCFTILFYDTVTNYVLMT